MVMIISHRYHAILVGLCRMFIGNIIHIATLVGTVVYVIFRPNKTALAAVGFEPTPPKRLVP